VGKLKMLYAKFGKISIQNLNCGGNSKFPILNETAVFISSLHFQKFRNPTMSPLYFQKCGVSHISLHFQKHKNLNMSPFHFKK
jgi:hypothetical protein